MALKDRYMCHTEKKRESGNIYYNSKLVQFSDISEKAEAKKAFAKKLLLGNFFSRPTPEP